jgi:hypothetical protein
MSLSSQLLDSKWFKNAYEANWLEQQLKLISADAERLYEQYYDEDNGCFNTDYETLYTVGEVAASALVLTSTWDEEDTRPIKVAIELDSPELVLAIMGFEGLSQCSEDNYLAIAVAHNNRAIFNLLLLHPDVNVNDGYEFDREDRDIAEFFGNYKWYDYFSPLIWLIEDQYSFLYPHLNIDWDEAVTDHNGSPLLVHFYNKRDFDSMGRLADLKVDINPEVGEANTCLFHKVLNDFCDNKPDSQLGAKWYAMQTDHVTQDELSTLLFEFYEFNEPSSSVYEHFPFFQITTLKNELSELTDKLEALTDEFDAIDKLINQHSVRGNRWRQREPSEGTSIIEDLLRLNIVKLEEGVIDIQFAITDMGIEFGVLYERQVYLSWILLPHVVIDKVVSIDLDLLHHMTIFQRQAALLSCSPSLYLALNIIAEDQGLPLFRSIKGHRVVSIQRQTIISDIWASGVNDKDDFFDRLCLELDEYDSLRSLLSGLNVLKSLFSYDDLKELREYRHGGYKPEPKLSIELARGDQSRVILVHCDIEGEMVSFSHAIEDVTLIDDWAEILFREPIAIACKQCQAVGFRHSFAYEEECMECINA